jgi:hypothetical protein
VKYLEPALQCGNYAYLLKHLVRDKKKGYVYLVSYTCILMLLLRLHLLIASLVSKAAVSITAGAEFIPNR